MELEVHLTMRVQVYDDVQPPPGSAKAVAWLGRFGESIARQLQVPQSLSGREFAVQSVEARGVERV